MKKNDNLYFASCPRGTEEILLEEAKQLHLHPTKAKGGISFRTNDKNAIEFILSTRIASRVFKELHTFNIRHEKEIYKNGRDVEWDKFLSVTDTFKISTLLDREANTFFRNSMFLSQLLKDSLCDHMRNKFEKRPNVELKDPRASFLQRIEATEKKGDYRVQLYVDMTGISLDKRGYREKGHFAPLRENLAAAIIMSTDWKKETETFFDPMVGSGTLLIEAIMYKENIPPSYLQLKTDTTPYAFTRQKWFQDSNLPDWYFETIHNIIEVSKTKIENMKEGTFFANDIEEDSIKLAKKHLRKSLGRINFIEFTSDNFLEMTPPEKMPNVLVFNPPYGERLEVDTDINDFYHEIGETLKHKYTGSRAYIFTLHGPLRNNIRLKTTMKKQFYNGELDCRLFRYELS